MSIKLKELASHLGLSISTVSRALQDSHEVSEATKKKVLAAAQALNYQPNPYASSLRQQKSKTIAVVVPEIANNYFSQAINGIEEVAQEKGYHVLIYLTHEDYQKEIAIARHLLSGRVDGIIMSVSSETSDVVHLKALYENKIPMVFFDRVCETIDTAKVITDDFESAFKATEHLVENRCQNIAYFQISDTLSIGKKRLQGFTDAALKHGIFREELIITFGNNDDDNYKQIKNLLASQQEIDGIFASVERLAISSYQACHNMGLSIPEDLRILGFSNLYTAPLLSPALTTITQPAFEMGAEAAKLLFRALNKYNTLPVKDTVVIKSSLIARQSTLLSE